METKTNDETNWNLTGKILFRLFFSYYAIFICSPFLGILWQSVIPFIAKHIFHISGEISTSAGGSGDTTFNYLQLFTRLCIAVLAVVVWSILDRKRNHYRKLLQYLIVALRYYLAFIMLFYGLSKVFTNQYSELSLFDLIKPYGHSSPMGLLWNFMEYSDGYTIFSGIMETIGGLLLLFRYTTRLGALVSFGVMLHVLVLNMSYDVPVKLFSSHLMFMAIFILIPDIKNFIRFFLLNKSTSPISIRPYFKKKAWNTTGYIIKGVLIIGGIGTLSVMQFQQQKSYGKKSSLPPLYGIYDVQQFIQNQDTILPLTTDTLRWKQLVIDKWYGGIVKLNDQILYFESTTDTINKHINLVSFPDTTAIYHFTYQNKKDSILTLQGQYKGDSLHIKLKRKDLDDFLLLNRGFRWISEAPFNR